MPAILTPWAEWQNPSRRYGECCFKQIGDTARRLADALRTSAPACQRVTNMKRAVLDSALRPGPTCGLLRFRRVGMLGFEINVDLLADDEGSRIGQIHDDLQHLDVAELMRIVGIDPALTDNAGDG